MSLACSAARFNPSPRRGCGLDESGPEPYHQAVVHPMRQLAGDLLQLVMPRVCVACGRSAPEARPICTSCAPDLLDLLSQPFCCRCGATIPEGLSTDEDADLGCAACPSPMPRFATVVRLGEYSQGLRNAVRRFKFYRDTHLRNWLAQMLAQRIEAQGLIEDIDAIQAVPLHWLRGWRRGFNQAELLARGLSKSLGADDLDAVVRTRNTPSQVGLSRRQRQRNVRGAFALRPGVSVDGLSVLLVDDVTTTGATADEVTRVLLAGGARRVHLAVVGKSLSRRAARNFSGSSSRDLN